MEEPVLPIQQESIVPTPEIASVSASVESAASPEEPVSPTEIVNEEWNEVADNLWQSKSIAPFFKDRDKAWYLDAIEWKDEDTGEVFFGTVQDVTSKQLVKHFPFEPKTFTVDVTKIGYDPEKHKGYMVFDVGTTKMVYVVKDGNQLTPVFSYYNRLFADVN